MPLEAQGEFALVNSKLEAALGKEGQPVSWGTMAHDHDVYMLLVESALGMSDASLLEKYTPELEILSKRDDHQLYLAIALRARGALLRMKGAYGDSAGCLQEALRIFEKLGTRWQYGRTMVEWARLMQLQGEMTSVDDAYAEALNCFEEMGAKPDKERTQLELEMIK